MVNLREKQPDAPYLLGILNSKLMQAIWLDRFYDQRRTFPKIKGTYLKQLPIRVVNFSEKSEKAKHDQMVSLVERMLDLHKRLAAARTRTTGHACNRRLTPPTARSTGSSTTSTV
jgi:hypothetical protein